MSDFDVRGAVRKMLDEHREAFDHLAYSDGPVCGHPELVMGSIWNESTRRLEPAPKPPPASMVGPCEHNRACPVCGFGWGSSPDNCKKYPA